MTLLAAWTHSLDPFVFRISGDFGIRWYGLAYVTGFAAAWWLLTMMARRSLILLKPEQVADVLLSVVLGVLVGGRLGYVLVYDPSLLGFRSTFPFWGVFAVWQGGMASHGGMVGIIVACLWQARRCRVPALHLMDCFAFVAPVGVFMGRLANFINGELLGKIAVQPAEAAAASTLPWWGVRFPQELVERPHESQLTQTQRDELAQLLASIDPTGSHAASGGGLEWMRDAARVAIDRIQHGDKALAEALSPYLSIRHPSQLYQAAVEGLVLGGILAIIWARPRRPGVILGWFFIIYGVGRIATEFWRLPDAQFDDPRPWGLSRGQWLSAVMVVAGVAVLGWVWVRAKPMLVGGWATHSHAGASKRRTATTL